MRVLGDHLHTSLLGHLHDGCVPFFPKGFRVILKGQAGHPPFLWGRESVMLTTVGEKEAGRALSSLPRRNQARGETRQNKLRTTT